jgi:hypothetical protein
MPQESLIDEAETSDTGQRHALFLPGIFSCVFRQVFPVPDLLARRPIAFLMQKRSVSTSISLLVYRIVCSHK